MAYGLGAYGQNGQTSGLNMRTLAASLRSAAATDPSAWREAFEALRRAAAAKSRIAREVNLSRVRVFLEQRLTTQNQIIRQRRPSAGERAPMGQTSQRVVRGSARVSCQGEDGRAYPDESGLEQGKMSARALAFYRGSGGLGCRLRSCHCRYEGREVLCWSGREATPERALTAAPWVPLLGRSVRLSLTPCEEAPLAPYRRVEEGTLSECGSTSATPVF